LSCGHVHDEDDPRLGEPICLDCFDHEGAVAWNNALGELWRRTVPVYLPRVMARLAEMTQERLHRLVRARYVKVTEYQRRGLVQRARRDPARSRDARLPRARDRTAPARVRRRAARGRDPHRRR
jgi:hypothetical protein